MHDVISRIAIFGDLHGNAEATRAVLADIDTGGAPKESMRARSVNQ